MMDTIVRIGNIMPVFSMFYASAPCEMALIGYEDALYDQEYRAAEQLS